MATLMRWSLLTEMSTLREKMNRLFSESLPRASFEGEEETSQGDWIPAVDIHQKNGVLVVKADLPGMTVADVRLEVRNNLLILGGERREDREQNYCRMERPSGSFQRTFALPFKVNPEEVRARLENGILEIVLLPR